MNFIYIFWQILILFLLLFQNMKSEAEIRDRIKQLKVLSNNPIKYLGADTILIRIDELNWVLKEPK